MMGPGEQPASARARPRPAAHEVRSNTRVILRKATDKPETDGDSMDYNMTSIELIWPQQGCAFANAKGARNHVVKRSLRGGAVRANSGDRELAISGWTSQPQDLPATSTLRHFRGMLRA